MQTLKRNAVPAKQLQRLGVDPVVGRTKGRQVCQLTLKVFDRLVLFDAFFVQ